MNYALTVNKDGIITGVHESQKPISATTFAASPDYAAHQVIPLPDPTQYRVGAHLMCYNADGKRKPDVWCIQNGYMALPPDKEIINGELVDIKAPFEEAPEIVKTILLGLQAKVAELENKLTTQAETLGRIALKVEPIEPIGPIEEAKL